MTRHNTIAVPTYTNQIETGHDQRGQWVRNVALDIGEWGLDEIVIAHSPKVYLGTKEQKTYGPRNTLQNPGPGQVVSE